MYQTTAVCDLTSSSGGVTVVAASGAATATAAVRHIPITSSATAKLTRLVTTASAAAVRRGAAREPVPVGAAAIVKRSRYQRSTRRSIVTLVRPYVAVE